MNNHPNPKLALGLALSVLTVSWAAYAGESVKVGDPNTAGTSKPMNRPPEFITTLSKADRFYGPTPGESGSNPVQSAYVEASGKVGQLEINDLNWLLKNGTAAGRIYGAVLLWQTGRIGSNLSYDLLLNDAAAVEYQNGCKVMGTTVKEVAQSLKDTQKFMNFQVGSMFCKLKAPVESPTAKPTVSIGSPITEKERAIYPQIEKALRIKSVPPGVHVAPFPRPACFTKLIQATSFDYSTLGESGKLSPNWQAFIDAKVITPRLPDEAEDLIKNGTPAGRLYGAILLYESSKAGHATTFEKLKSDNAAVVYRSGCEKESTTVAKIAKSFIENNAYNDFKLNINCELLAPTKTAAPKKETPKTKSYGYSSYSRTLGAGQTETLVCPGCKHIMRMKKKEL